MSSGGSSSPVVQQTQSTSPWSGVQPYLSSIYGGAEQMRQANEGYQPYTGQTQADLDPNLAAGLGNQVNLANFYAQTFGPPSITGATSQAANIINQQGITSGVQNALGGLGQVTGQYGQVFANQEPANVYRNIIQQAQGQQNPYLQQILDAQNRRIGDRINASFSGAGRYGSGQHTDVMARALAEAEAPILAQDYEARQQRLGQAAQGLLGVGQQQLAATQGLGGAYGTMADIYGRGLQQAGQWAQAAPALEAARYDPAERMAAAGQFYQQRAQQQLADQIALYNAQQAYPWQNLQREAGILAGAGQLGGTTVTSQPAASPLQRLLGGGIAGAGLGSAFGPVGAGIGGLAGAGLGYFL